MEEQILSLKWDSNIVVSEFDDISDYVHETQGNIVVNEDVVIGHFNVIMIDLEGSLDADIHPVDIFDSSATMAHYFHVLYNKRSLELKDSIWNQLENPLSPNILILDRIEIEPAYRGKAIGKAVLMTLCKTIGRNCGIAVMKPFPLQFESNYASTLGTAKNDLSQFTTNEKAATRKLKQYYASMGFETIKGSPFMAMSLENRMPPLPSINWHSSHASSIETA